MKDYISIGSAPCNEDCIQVDPKTDYIFAMKIECNKFRDLIRDKLGPEPLGANLCVKAFPHDFGTYYEVVCFYDTDNEVAKEYAFKCEADSPTNWT